MNRGNAYKDLGEFELALVDYNASIGLNKRNPQAFNNRGIIYRDVGEYSRAIDDFGFAINADPDYAYAYANRAVAKAIMGRDFEVREGR